MRSSLPVNRDRAGNLVQPRMRNRKIINEAEVNREEHQ